MKQEFREISSASVEEESMSHLEEVIGELDDVEIVEISREWLARIIHEILRLSYGT